jgi:DNA-directed RNA polymerase subunit D
MKLVLDKKHGNRIEFVAGGVEASFANMVRRYSMARVPVFAMDKVTFYDNTSAFWDEYIAHRLGLMPIVTPDKSPEGAEVVFTLDAQGPKVVYASDMTSTDKEVVIAKGNIAIVTLGPEQRLRFEGKAVLGIGRTHAKYQAGLLSYGEDKNGLRFMVESFYHMEPIDVLARGCDVIESDIETIEEALGVPSKKKKKAKAEKPEKAEKEEKAEEPSEAAAEKPAKKKAKKKKEAEEKPEKKEE